MKWLAIVLLAASAATAGTLSVTESSVNRVHGDVVVADCNSATAGALLNFGSGTWQLHTDDGAPSTSTDVGIALVTTNSTEQACVIQLNGRVELGATTVAGEVYVGNIDDSGSTDGEIVDIADWSDGGSDDNSTSGNFLVVVGIGVDTGGTIDLTPTLIDIHVDSGVLTANP